MMKKTLSKALSLLLTVALICSMSIVAFAAYGDDNDGEIISITIKGKSADLTGRNTDFDSVTEKTITITTEEAEFATSGVVISEKTTSAAEAYLVAADDDSNVVQWDTDDNNSVEDLGAAYTDGAVEDGDVIYVRDGYSTAYNYFKFVIAIDDDDDNDDSGTDPNGSISGESTVDNVVLNVILPTNLNFALDPLELGKNTKGSQIKAADYVVVNKTGAPVNVAFSLTATPKSGVTLVDDASTLEKDDTSVVDKNIYFAALGANDVTAGTLDFSTIPGTAKFDYDAETDTLVGLKVINEEGTDKGKAKGSITFALGAATASADDLDTLAEQDKGIASFQFYGEMNPYAKWEAGDVTVSGAYTLIALRKTTYENYAADSAYTEDGLNQLAPPATASATPTLNTDLSKTKAVTVGDTVTLGVSASVTDSGKLTYEWTKDGVTIADADANELVITNAQTTDSGSYKVVVTNTKGKLPAATATSEVCAVTVSAAASNDATLSNLVLSSGTLTPAFASGTDSYTASVANDVASVTVTPTVNDANATVKINGTTVASGSASNPISLTVGSTNTITLIVTAEDDSTKTYTVNVTRADPVNDVKIAASETKQLAASRTTWATTPMKIYLSDYPASVTSVAFGAATFAATTDYTYDASTGVLTVTRVPGGVATSLVATIVAGGGTYTLDVTFA